MLCVVDVATGRRTEPELGATVATFEWAPDSKAIAVGGVLYGKPVNVLCIVSLPSGKTQTIDTLGVFSDYELAWSPDSRHLVVPRPTEVSHQEEVLAADLWIFDRAGHRCRLTNTPDFVESKPQWIDATRLQYERHRTHGDLYTEPEIVVVELTRPKAARGAIGGGS
jgi:hypothetical protein